MIDYLHHIIFDPLSVWEKFKADMLFFAVVVGIISSLVFATYIRDFFKRK
jgi:hypothetical protein